MVGNVSYYVLLVGIDAYKGKPLYGCVNDIDAIQRILVERADVPVGNIRRLASPHIPAGAPPTPPEQAATLDNIRAALKFLASEEITDKHRVLVYYSGHGARLTFRPPSGAAQYNCEALVPVDFDQSPLEERLLFDFELNGLLRAITKRTKSVCFVLDCCHSAGATRDVPNRPLRVSRILGAEDLGVTGPITASPAMADKLATGERGMGGNVDDCQVVAACLNHELAQEDVTPQGVRHGLLTNALVSELHKIDKNEIRSVPWARIWQKMRDTVETANPDQHLWMTGSFARAVLAGPVVDSDAGFAIARVTGENKYIIDAGTLADVDEGASLAVYGEEPKRFPDIDSPADIAARLNPSLIVVEKEPGRASATGRCAGAPFDIPAGARARVVAASLKNKLRCAVLPDNPIIRSALSSPMLALTSEADSQVRLVQRAGGWTLEDDIAGAKGNPPLITLKSDKDLQRAGTLMAIYQRYSLPLRMARRCADLPGKLQVTALLCPEDGIDEDKAAAAVLPDCPAHAALTYGLKIGGRFCIQIRNASIYDLRVTVVNCAASGKVELLGDQVISARASQRFWQNNAVGNPFVVTEVQGNRRYIDRMVAIGTTHLGKDLKYLANPDRFSTVFDPTREVTTKEVSPGGTGEPLVEKWTATEFTFGMGL